MNAPAAPATRGQVWAWGLWDWGSAAFNAVILTFVFSRYLVEGVADDPVRATSLLGWTLGAAGLLVALAAPVVGQRADGAGRRRRSVAAWTALTVLSMAAMFAVVDDHAYLALGLGLLALGSVTFEFATVSYYAMLRQVSTPATIGRVSGFGWALGYFGGIVLLSLVYFGLVAGEGGLLGVPTEDGLNIRVVALVAAVWFALFALPMLLVVPELPPAADLPARAGVLASYRTLVADLRALLRTDRHTVYFLLASALFRDGLGAIFTFGAIIAAAYGIGADDVLLFGIAANVIAGLGALVGGRLDDRIGPKAVIVGSLVGILLVGSVLMVLSGPVAFWTGGLALTLFVGPAQSSSRAFLARLAPPGREGQLFGLYATTGRAVSFLAPSLVGLFTFLFDSTRAGMAGILVVIAIGLAALWRVRPPAATHPRGDAQAARV
ncbi:MAG TPA: MFS transporter [Pseudonocardia sp.]|jgi:MFS transporter, UMF1 family|nr:MFS transporter [Pseudonocardia sp.]